MATLSHIDTCLPCYLQDHHNRPGELLLGVPVDGATTYLQVKETLFEEFRSLADERAPDTAVFSAALEDCFETIKDLDATFDDSLEPPCEEDFRDGPQAWFLLAWETPEEE